MCQSILPGIFLVALTIASVVLPFPARALGQEDIRAALAETSGPLIPKLDTATVETLAESGVGQELLAWAQEGGFEIPHTTYTLYRTYRTEGTRPPYERPYFAKRGMLTRAVLLAWLGRDDGAIDHVNDLLWNLCEETTWVAPAHEDRHKKIDLFAAELAASLGYTLHLLGDRIPEEIRSRVESEVDRRILDPYLADPYGWGWGDGGSNWTGVCAGSVGEAFLLFETNPDRQAVALNTALEQLNKYIQRAFTADGASLEGLGYWQYGLMHYVILGEMLRSRTEGRIDLLAEDRMARIAAFPLVMALDEDTCINFADAGAGVSIQPYTAAIFAERYGLDSLKALAGGPGAWRLDVSLFNLLYWKGRGDAVFEIEDAYLEDAAVAKRVVRSGAHTIVLAAKAGHNAEPHNNNDVGSFIVYADGVTYLCDPGAGLYSKDYFGAKRYDNLFAGARGHSLPVVNGIIQPAGAKARGTMTVSGDGVFDIMFHEAYPVEGLTEARRQLKLADDGAITLTDTFRLDGDLAVREPFMTWLDVETEGNTARVISEKGVLTITVEGATFHAERLEKECKANHKRGVLTRIYADLEGERELTCRFDMTYTPNTN